MERRTFLRQSLLAAGATTLGSVPSAIRAADMGDHVREPGRLRPRVDELLGLNVHTVAFKPELYRPVCRLVRDYHNLDWDVGNETNYQPRFPMSRNRVDWQELYGGWKKAGYTVDVSLQLNSLPASRWKNLARDAFGYGVAFARFFGPAGTQPLVESMEIGNEPGNFNDAEYRTLFENMAQGLRHGDPGLKVVTCAAVTGKSEQYAKSVSCVKGLESLYDVLNLHTYAFVEQYPTWRRSFPEDPKISYLKPVREMIAWRNANAPGKPIWVTEFGWDASTKPPPKTGDFSKWMSSTETEQARYLVRSLLVFAGMDVDRAYIYFFDDKDEPQLHGSSGLTRNYVPKPAFHAVAHLYRTLGSYRFVRAVVEDPGKLYLYEFQSAVTPAERVWVAWSPTGSNQEMAVTLPAPTTKPYRAERMPLKASPDGAGETVKWETDAGGKLQLTMSESPSYFWFRSA